MGKEVPAADERLTPPPRDDGDDLVRHTAVMSAGTALSRLTGFLRVAAMAYALGVAETRLADAYNVANNVPNIVYELILGGVLSSVFVPVFVEQLARSREDAWHVARAVMTGTLVVLGIITLLGIVAAPWIVRLYTFRLPEEARAATQDVAALLLRLFMPQILFYGMGAVATGLLNAHRRFAPPMFAPVLNNLVVIAAFLTFAAMPVDGIPSPESIGLAHRLVLGLGTTAGVVAMTVVLWPYLRRVGFRWRWAFDLRHPAVRKLVRLSVWTVAYVVVNQLGLLVVIVLASGQQGGYTAYQAAFIFFQLPHALFAVSIMTALLPSLSGLWVRGDAAGFREALGRGIRASAFVVVPAAVGYIALARPIVRLLLEHGVATGESTELVAGVLSVFALGLFSFSVFQLFLRAFYAMQDTRTPLLINVLGVGVNTAVNLALFPLLQVRGLALGHAIGYTVAAVTAAWVLRRRLAGLHGETVVPALAKVAAGAAATGAAAWAAAVAVERGLGTDTLGAQMAQVAAGVLAGVVVFLGAAAVLRMEELRQVTRALAARLGR